MFVKVFAHISCRLLNNLMLPRDFIGHVKKSSFGSTSTHITDWNKALGVFKGLVSE